jgi:hypothetical protein
MRKMKQQSQEDRERWNSVSKADEAEEYSTSIEARVTTEEAQVNAQTMQSPEASYAVSSLARRDDKEF